MIKKNNRPILVYRFSSLGDIAMTVPVLRSFFQTYPNQKIVFASRPYAAPLFKEFQNLEFVPIDLNNNYKGLYGLLNLFRKLKKNKVKINYFVGTMIELPRAALRAAPISKYADFFSFGTNDLTQTTFGISRDDSGKFLNDYINNKIFDVDPFVSIDQNGVGELVEIASERGKKINKKIKLGICGEHGGDPKSIEFCSRTGLDYVSCSPFRVPVARLAAAQAELSK